MNPCSPPPFWGFAAFLNTCRLRHVRPGGYLLFIRVASQTMDLYEHHGCTGWSKSDWLWENRYLVSTSRYGTGNVANSRQTPLGLHEIARKAGMGHPPGTVFQGRQAVGYTWQGHPDAPIAHRILWLRGLEPGFNQGGMVDTFARYIYIHGVGDATTLGRPASIGCVHVAAADLIPLADRLSIGTLVWIAQQ